MRKTGRYENKVMTRNNAANYFLEVCKNYNSLCESLRHSSCQIMIAEQRLTGMNGISYDGIFGSTSSNGKSYDEKMWTVVLSEQQNVEMCESALKWIDSIIAKLENPRYVMCILYCYIGRKRTMSDYARKIKVNVDNFRKMLIEEIDKRISDDDILNFNCMFNVTETVRQKLIEAKKSD